MIVTIKQISYINGILELIRENLLLNAKFLLKWISYRYESAKRDSYAIQNWTKKYHCKYISKTGLFEHLKCPEISFLLHYCWSTFFVPKFKYIGTFLELPTQWLGKKLSLIIYWMKWKLKKTLTAHTVLKNKDSFLEYLFVESMRI